MRKIYNTLTFILLIIHSAVFGQWMARTGMGQSNTRTFSTSFSVNGKIYVVGGAMNFSGYNDVWEYNITSDTWTQKANFPGGVRGGSSAFTIGNKAYYMCGTDFTGQFFSDVWEYDPATDTWIQKADFPGIARHEGVAFTIGNRGYFGTGYVEVVGPNSTFWDTLDDFYEYDPATDTWTVKASVPGQPRGWAIGVACAGRGYIGLGGDENQTGSYSDFYEYDPLANTWTAKANYPLQMAESAAFTLGDTIYVCGGINFANLAGTPAVRKFMPSTNTWTTLPNFNGNAIIAAVAATVSNRAFLGTGFTAALAERQDWWEFGSPPPPLCPVPLAFSTATGVATGPQVCRGKITVSNITNGCGPYTVTVLPATGTVQAGANSTFTISNLCAGVYTVTVTDNCCGPMPKTCTVSASPATGISNNFADDTYLTISPNPTTGNFLLQSNLPGLQPEVNIIITDVMGKQISFSMENRGAITEVFITEPRSGIYFVRYTSTTGLTLIKKLVVN